jgi:hypothetical protein
MCVKDCPIKNPRQIVETISGLLFHAKFKSILKICYELKDKIVIFFGSIDMLNAIVIYGVFELCYFYFYYFDNF